MLQRWCSGLVSAGVGAKVLATSGIVRPYSPLVMARVATTLARWGPGPAGGFIALAEREPDRIAVLDELGSLTHRDLHRRSNAVAHALRQRGVGEGDGVAIMCRNHRGFLDATNAAAKLGADILYLNTAFAGPQLREVLARDRPRAVIFDEEFAALLAATDVPVKILGWTDEPGEGDSLESLESLIEDGDPADLAPPDRHARIVILTSGTTGTPKGAPRGEAGIGAAVALLSALPLRYGWRTHIAAPLFHTWGFGHLALSMLLGSTVVLRRHFDPAGALGVLEQERCESFVVVPVMLQRILALPQSQTRSLDLSRLRVVASSGSALPGDLAVDWMDRFGPNLYSTYGSTEVAYAAVASPADLRQAPSSAGRMPHGTVVRILDEHGREVPTGQPGRIFVGNGLLFEGYIGGGTKEVVDGLMSTGDVGRFGADGRLYVEGRDDEMIVSGGENVFPKEVEDCIARHDQVLEAAAIGVPDDDFGQRLRAFVVRAPGTSLTADDVRDWVRQNLARYKVPRDVEFLDQLPRNATGKVLKRELM